MTKRQSSEKVKDLGWTLPGPREYAHLCGLAFITPPAILAPRESDPRNTSTSTIQGLDVPPLVCQIRVLYA